METNEKEKPKTELQEYLDSVPAGDIKHLKERMIEKARTNGIVFRNWRLGLTKVPPLERDIINYISFGYNGKNVFEPVDDGSEQNEP